MTENEYITNLKRVHKKLFAAERVIMRTKELERFACAAYAAGLQHGLDVNQTSKSIFEQVFGPRGKL